MIKLLGLSVVLLLLTGCVSATPTLPVGLEAIVDNADMIWLGQNLDNIEWSHLEAWLKRDLIPYVSGLEAIVNNLEGGH